MSFHLSRKAITRMQAILAIVIVIIAAVGGIYAYYTTLTPQAGNPIKIALIPPLTGPAARTGKELQDGVLFAYDELKAAGKIPVKVDGQLRDIQFMWVDSKSDPEEAVKAYTDAIVSGGADILGWNWHSSVAMALYKISTKYNKIHFGDVGETQFLSLERAKNPDESKYWFKYWAAPPCYGSLFAPALEDAMKDVGFTPKTKTIAILLEDTDYGRGMGDALKDAFAKAGWNVAYYDVFSLSPPESDFTPFISKYKTAGVSVVYQISTGLPSMNAFLKQSYEAGLPALRGSFGIGWSSISEWYPALKEASDYVLSMDSNAIITTAQKDFVTRFQAAKGYAPSAVVAGYWGYDAFSMLIEGLNKAGTMNVDTLRRTLLDMEYKGIFMTTKFSENANPPGTCCLGPMEIIADGDHFHFPLQQWKGGVATPIWPAAEAQGKLEIPPILAGAPGNFEVPPILAGTAGNFVTPPILAGAPGKFEVPSYLGG